jgi:hypothetical protein
MSVFHNNVLSGAAGQGGAAAGGVATKSLRFNKPDSAHLDKTFSSAGNRKKWTFAAWVKRSLFGASQRILRAVSGSTEAGIQFLSGEKIELYDYSGGYTWQLNTSALFRDPSAWYHIVVAFDTTQATAADRVSLYVNGSEVTDFSTSTYPSQNFEGLVNNNVQHSIAGQDGLKFGGYMADIYFIDGSALDATSFGAFDDNGVWQVAEYDGTFGTNGFHLLDFANESTIGHDSSGNENDFTANNLSPFRAGNGTYGATISNSTLNNDPSVIFNGTPSSSYVDRPTNNSTVTFTGIPQASTSVRIYLTSLESGTMTTNGSYAVSPGSQFPNAYIEPTNVSYPFTLTSITVTGGSSSHGYGIGAIEVDGVVLDNGSGSDTDVLFDAPTNGSQSDTGAGGEVSGNYCVFNPLSSRRLGVLSDGNLKTVFSGDSTRAEGTIAVNSGKFYWEAEAITNMQTHTIGGRIGICETNRINIQSAERVEFDIDWHANSGVRLRRAGYSSVSLSTGTNYNDGDLIGVALDVDNSTVKFYKNGSLAYNIDFSSYVTAGSKFLTAHSWGYFTSTWVYNFGARPFVHAAPSGYKTLCSTNLTTPTIADGSDYFDIDLYTGTGTTHERSEFSFSPDFVWIKQRNTTRNNLLFDTVRGANEFAVSNSSGDPGTGSGMVTSFDSDGFTLGNSADVNQSNGTFCAWCWDAGTSTVSNTDGSVTTSVRANATAGCSIVQFTVPSGSDLKSYGHGLNAEPSIIFTKRTNGSGNWQVFTNATGSNQSLTLNSNAAASAASSSNYASGSSTFSLKNGHYTDTGWEVIAYCFAPVAGYSHFSSWEGNGSTDGPFVYTGFRPKFIIMKGASSGGANYNWAFVDTERGAGNVSNHTLAANLNNGESYFGNGANAFGPNNKLDILSNGFKPRESATFHNTSGVTYIFMAWAENPFQANGGLAR